MIFEMTPLPADGARTPADRARVMEAVKKMLRKRFPNEPSKQDVRDMSFAGRLNFACPFCGDSSRDVRKKRGNLYLEGLHFKCYNGGCDRYSDLLSMLDEFGVPDALSSDERADVAIAIREAGAARARTHAERESANLAMLTGTDYAGLLVPRDRLMGALGLSEVRPGTPTGTYLEKRAQPLGRQFAWDNRRRRLFLLNLDSSCEMVFGLQVRPMDGAARGTKYLTYGLDAVYEKFLREPERAEAAREMSRLSVVFGMLTVDFSSPITVFEGPMDHFLYPNSAATCGTGVDWPVDAGDLRRFQDNDKAGRKLAVDLLERRQPVFLWRRYLDDADLRGSHVKDYNDLVVHSLANAVRLPDVAGYFSADPRDILYV